ncbi:MAG: sel1 repeat family protein [Pseudomonadales bacterium]|nr:sel1 repeat family protein [Pseudomonadales bacterium]
MEYIDIQKLVKKAEKGDVIAQKSLAARYATGDGIEKSFEQAIYWYERACEYDDPEAYYNLGTMVLIGEGLQKDESRAIDLFFEAIENGSSDASFVIGDAYLSGMFGLEKNIKQAVRYYLNGAVLGAPRGIRLVGGLVTEQRITAEELAEAMLQFSSVDKIER